MGRPIERTLDLNWDNLDQPALNLHSLDDPFSEDEIKTAIFQMPADIALGPDGYTGAFFRACWDVIKGDFMEAVIAFHNLRISSLPLLNSANIVLIPMKEGIDYVTDCRRPISLIHSFAKIIAKALALRLAPYMKTIVPPTQSAFIKKRSIHDNFMAVRNTARSFHRNNIPALFIKLDITKAFDSVRWDYLRTLLQRLGFPPRWRDWIASLLATSTSRFLLNEVPSTPLKHGRGLRQGDPLSPLLFVITIDLLRRLLDLAIERAILSKLRGTHAQH